MTQKWDKCSWKPLMAAYIRKSSMPKHVGVHTPSQPQTEFLLFLFFAVSLVPPSGCLGLRGNPLSLHSIPHVLVVVLTVKIQDSLPTPSWRQLFLSSMWVSNIWTANPTVDGWMKSRVMLCSLGKRETALFALRLHNVASAPPGVSIVATAESVSTT